MNNDDLGYNVSRPSQRIFMHSVDEYMLTSEDKYIIGAVHFSNDGMTKRTSSDPIGSLCILPCVIASFNRELEVD
jgi:hypothetical protein